jgi:hypothetical protein
LGQVVTTREFRAILVVAVVLGGIYLSFELGRYQSGYSLLDARRQTTEFAEYRAASSATIDDLQRQVARLETSREIDQETYSTIEANLAELQARIQAQEEELVFYRGIVSPGDGVAGLRVQNVEVEPGVNGETHLLHLLLVQAIVQNDRVTGSVRPRLIGTLNGEAAELWLDEFGFESSSAEIAYGFRIYQDLIVPLALPEDFVPAELEIQVWPQSPRGETIVQSFPWSTISE